MHKKLPKDVWITESFKIKISMPILLNFRRNGGHKTTFGILEKFQN